MKRILSLLLLVFAGYVSAISQDYEDSLTTVDPELRKIFPRWKVCEPDLQVQIYQAFKLAGYPQNKLNMQSIEVLAAPKENPMDPYELLSVSCGHIYLKAVEIKRVLGSTIPDYLSGNLTYNREKIRMEENGKDPDYKRSYCYSEIPPELPVHPNQSVAIVDYMSRPTDKKQAIILSLFEQSVKIGETGFWLTNKFGVDQIGYQFWSVGENKLVLQRPLYTNNDPYTKEPIPYLINAHLGAAYRSTAGVDPQGALSWVPATRLNSTPGGKIVGGLDVHMPFKPQFGVSLNLELPMQNLTTQSVDLSTYATYPIPEAQMEVLDVSESPDVIDLSEAVIVPILRSSGQLTFFFMHWLNFDTDPENYFRIDLGLNYTDVREYLGYVAPGENGGTIQKISNVGIQGLATYKNDDAADWLFVKAEYRNQAAFPFGASIQYSNENLMIKGYIPIFGNWLLLEGRYTTPLRAKEDERYYEIKNFFMVSPVLRLTI